MEKVKNLIEELEQEIKANVELKMGYRDLIYDACREVAVADKRDLDTQGLLKDIKRHNAVIEQIETKNHELHAKISILKEL